MFEVLHHYMPRIQASDVLTRHRLEAQQFFVVSAHREENVDSPERLATLAESLRQLGAKYQIPVVVSTHPRTRQRLEAAGLSFGERALLLKPLGFTDYVRLELEARAVLSDSARLPRNRRF